MKTSKTLSVSFLTLALGLSGAAIATAQSTTTAPNTPAASDSDMARKAHFRGDNGRAGHHKAHHKKHGRGHGGMFGGGMFRTIFDAVDANGDKSVTAEEIDAYRAEQIGAVDTSGDGSLSIDEFDTLYRAFTRSRMVDAFQRLDADGDGQITPAEIDTPLERMVERMDRDGDGVLTLKRPGAASQADE